MESILNLFKCPIDEIEILKKKTKSKNKLSIIEKYENLFEEVKEKIITNYENDSFVDKEFITFQINNLKKFIQILTNGELKGLLAKESLIELNLVTNQLKKLNSIILEQNNEIELLKKKNKEIENLIENKNSKENKLKLKEIRKELEKEMKSKYQNKKIEILPLTKMSQIREDNLLELIEKQEESLEECKKIRETTNEIIYEIDKKFVDRFKEDKRIKPKINKNEKIIVTKNK